MMRKADSRSAAVEMAEITRSVERMRTGIREGDTVRLSPSPRPTCAQPERVSRQISAGLQALEP